MGRSNPAPNQKDSNFAFKCQRQKRNDGGFDVYAVNVITFNLHNALLTGGSDGCMTVWCKDTR